jgi:hypothetical protein
MSEETNVTINEVDNTQEVKKKSTKKLEITEQFQYIPENNEQLIVDKPSEPLKIKKKEVILETLNKKENIKLEKVIKSNKELYESYIKELKFFSLSVNNDIIYDSSIDKSKELPLKFDNDYFILYGKKYSYNGLKIQKISKK